MISRSLVLVVALATTLGASAQSQPVASSESGRSLFNFYCASCHGKDGRGSGPMAAALKVAPPNLTLITRKYGGVFPSAALISLLRDGDRSWVTSHGSREMPVWGPILQRSTDPDLAEVRLQSLLSYLRSIQAK